MAAVWGLTKYFLKSRESKACRPTPAKPIFYLKYYSQRFHCGFALVFTVIAVVILALKKNREKGRFEAKIHEYIWCLEPVFHPDSFEKDGKKRSLPREIRRE